MMSEAAGPQSAMWSDPPGAEFPVSVGDCSRCGTSSFRDGGVSGFGSSSAFRPDSAATTTASSLPPRERPTHPSVSNDAAAPARSWKAYTGTKTRALWTKVIREFHFRRWGNSSTRKCCISDAVLWGVYCTAIGFHFVLALSSCVIRATAAAVLTFCIISVGIAVAGTKSSRLVLLSAICQALLALLYFIGMIAGWSSFGSWFPRTDGDEGKPHIYIGVLNIIANSAWVVVSGTLRRRHNLMFSSSRASNRHFAHVSKTCEPGMLPSHSSASDGCLHSVADTKLRQSSLSPLRENPSSPQSHHPNSANTFPNDSPPSQTLDGPQDNKSGGTNAFGRAAAPSSSFTFQQHASIPKFYPAELHTAAVDVEDSSFQLASHSSWLASPRTPPSRFSEIPLHQRTSGSGIQADLSLRAQMQFPDEQHRRAPLYQSPA